MRSGRDDRMSYMFLAAPALLIYGLVIIVPSRALQRRVTSPLLVEQDSRLIEALLQILFTVLQSFDTPL